MKFPTRVQMLARTFGVSITTLVASVLAQEPVGSVPVLAPQATTEAINAALGPSQPQAPGLEPRVQGRLPRELILPPPSAEATADAKRFVAAEINPQLPLPLVLGRPKILQLAETPTRIFLADEQIANSQVLDQQSGREIAITGIKTGSTTLTMWFRDDSSPTGKTIVSYLVQVYADPQLVRPIDELQRSLNLSFPNSFVELDDLNGRLVVRGQARDAIEMANILRVLMGVRGATQDSQRRTSATTVSVEYGFNTPESVESRRQAEAEASIVDPTALVAAGIINLMRVPGEQQVMLKVTVAEINRTAARNIGLDFTATIGNNLIQSNTSGTPSNVAPAINTGTGLNSVGINPTNNALVGAGLDLRIQALRQLGFARTLAEPNLVAINGQPAQFEAGGQFPVPQFAASGGGGANLQGVQFVPFGVQLRFVPIIQDRDVIRLQLNAEVSSRNNGGGATVSGTFVPALDNRTFSSTVELRSGQTLAVAGLLQSSFTSTSRRIPFWGDLPLIGWTGNSSGTSSNEQELVILVTPELVAPIDACNAPGLPGNDVYEPTDVEFFLSNRLESRRGRDYRSTVRTDYAKIRRPDKCCPDPFLVGKVGPTDRCCNQVAERPHVLTAQSKDSTSGTQAASSRQSMLKSHSVHPAEETAIHEQPSRFSSTVPVTKRQAAAPVVHAKELGQ